MAVYDIGMTMEQAIQAAEPVKPNHYRMRFDGFLKNSQGDGSIFFPTSTGGKQVKARLTVISNDSENGKGLVYSCSIGTVFFSMLAKALPIITGTGIDDEAAIGMEVEADVTLEPYVDKNGEDQVSNKIKKLKAVA